VFYHHQHVAAYEVIAVFLVMMAVIRIAQLSKDIKWIVTYLKHSLLFLAIALTFSAMAEMKVSTQQSMHNYKWKHRLLITTVTSDTELNQLQDEVRYHNRDISARKILVVVHLKNKTYVIDASAPDTSSKKLASDLLSKEAITLLSENQGMVMLLGLDGGIKSRYVADTFTLEQAFKEIDLMPMRRLEIQGKFNG
jgi:hypothetical protein